jgi:tRNA(Ile)-lysidine synthase
MALAWLARLWGEPLALIVDHRLRAESTEEAGLTARRLAGMGIESRILTLRGLLPGPGLAARARGARYAALIAAAREAGLSDLLLGHHGGDQAETYLMREAAGSGSLGLACMAAIVEMPGLRLVRPLLGVPPGRLRAVLRAQGVGWVEDPGNRNPAASRTRVRQRLADPGGEGPEVAGLLARAHAAGLARRKSEIGLARRLAARVSLFPQGYAVVTPGQVEPDLLAALIRGLTGSGYPKGSDALARLASGPLLGTLGGVRFMAAGRHGPGVLAVREAAAMQAPVAAFAGCLWDGRFRLETQAVMPPGVQIGALGDDAARFRARSGLASVILRTLPAVRLAGRLVAVPHVGYFNGWTNQALRLSFCPPIPVSGAPFEVFSLGDAQTALAHHVLSVAAVVEPDEPGQTAGKY